MCFIFFYFLRLIKNKDKNTQSALSEIKTGGSCLRSQNINAVNNQEIKINGNNVEIKSQYFDLRKEENWDKKNIMEKKPLFSKEKYSDIFTSSQSQPKNENKNEHNNTLNDNFVFRFNYNL